jgi:hypothetical protein
MVTEEERTPGLDPAGRERTGPGGPGDEASDVVLVIRAWRDGGGGGPAEPGRPDDLRARILGVGRPEDADEDGPTVAVAQGVEAICAAVRRLLSPDPPCRGPGGPPHPP